MLEARESTEVPMLLSCGDETARPPSTSEESNTVSILSGFSSSKRIAAITDKCLADCNIIVKILEIVLQ